MSEEFHGTVRVRKWGGSMVIILPSEIREFFAVVHRDLLAYRKVGRSVLLRRISASQLMPVSEAEAQRSVSGEEK